MMICFVINCVIIIIMMIIIIFINRCTWIAVEASDLVNCSVSIKEDWQSRLYLLSDGRQLHVNSVALQNDWLPFVKCDACMKIGAGILRWLKPRLHIFYAGSGIQGQRVFDLCKTILCLLCILIFISSNRTQSWVMIVMHGWYISYSCVICNYSFIMIELERLICSCRNCIHIPGETILYN